MPSRLTAVKSYPTLGLGTRVRGTRVRGHSGTWALEDVGTRVRVGGGNTGTQGHKGRGDVGMQGLGGVGSTRALEDAGMWGRRHSATG